MDSRVSRGLSRPDSSPADVAGARTVRAKRLFY